LIIDAIDGVANKCLLIDQALKHSIAIICTGGGAGKLDVTQIKICDLAHTIHDPLLYRVRKKLRDKFDFSPYSKKKLIPFGVRTIYSTEMPKIKLNDDNTDCMIEGQACEQKMGSLVTVTGVIGMFAANETIRHIIHSDDNNSKDIQNATQIF
jgi:tRNA A37 threonylcarbamoyladenosine dehydratase